jgi:hypothetical protein
MTTNVPQDVIDDIEQTIFNEDLAPRDRLQRIYVRLPELRGQRAGGEAVAWDAEAFARLDQIDSNKWVVHKPEGAPYAGIRTKDGRTIAGTSSGLSDEHAQEICANQQNREYIKVLLEKITDLQRQIESHPPQPTQSRQAAQASFAAGMMKAAEICQDNAIAWAKVPVTMDDMPYPCDVSKECKDAILSAIPKESADALKEYVRGKCLELADEVHDYHAGHCDTEAIVNSVLGKGGK